MLWNNDNALHMHAAAAFFCDLWPATYDSICVTASCHKLYSLLPQGADVSLYVFATSRRRDVQTLRLVDWLRGWNQGLQGGWIDSVPLREWLDHSSRGQWNKLLWCGPDTPTGGSAWPSLDCREQAQAQHQEYIELHFFGA